MFLNFATIILVKQFECLLKVVLEDHVIYIKRCCQEIVKVQISVFGVLLSFSFLHYIIQSFIIFFASLSTLNKRGL